MIFATLKTVRNGIAKTLQFRASVFLKTIASFLGCSILNIDLLPVLEKYPQ
jgi:hypothetical protein